MRNAIIFDLDGTLWDSTGCICEIWNRVLDQEETIPLRVSQKMVANLMGKTMTQIGEILFPDRSEQERQRIVDRFGEEEVKYLFEHGAVLYEGVNQTIALLAKAYDLYIVSNSQDGYVPAFLHAHQLEQSFKDIEMSGRTGLEKGKNIRLLMERNHIGSAVYVGDTEGDEKAAREANIPFIYAAYGFGKAVSPDAAITSIRELPDVLRHWDNR